MRILTRMALASALAVGAALFAAGCGDTDCPSAIASGASCSSAGLSCDVGTSECRCVDGKWACDESDLPMLPVRDMSLPRDLMPSTD